MAEMYIPPPDLRTILRALAENYAADEKVMVTLIMYRNAADHSTEIFDWRPKK